MKRLALLLFLTLLGACSQRPATTEIEQQIRAELTGGGYGDVYRVENFRKVNGIAHEDGRYEAMVEYDLRFVTGVAGAAEALQQRSGSIFAAGAAVAELAAEYGHFASGDVIHRERRVRFVQTEQGWRIDGGLR